MINHQSINKRIYNVEAPINDLQRWLQTEGADAITLEFSEGIGYRLDGLGWVRSKQSGADVVSSQKFGVGKTDTTPYYRKLC